MKYIVYTNILVAGLLQAFALSKFDQNVTCLNQVPQVGFDSETYILTSWGIEWKLQCATLSILDNCMVQEFI